MARALAMLILMSLLGPAAGAQDKRPEGTLTLSHGTVGVRTGYTCSEGTLTYQGKTFPVKVDGLPVGEVGMNRADSAGRVYNLTKLEDFNGNYTATAVRRTAGGGAGVRR